MSTTSPIWHRRMVFVAIKNSASSPWASYVYYTYMNTFLQHLAYCKLWALTVLNARGMTTIFYLLFFMNGSSLTRTLFEFVLCCPLCSVLCCRFLQDSMLSIYIVVGFPPKGARKADIWFEDDRKLSPAGSIWRDHCFTRNRHQHFNSKQTAPAFVPVHDSRFQFFSVKQ